MVHFMGQTVVNQSRPPYHILPPSLLDETSAKFPQNEFLEFMATKLGDEAIDLNDLVNKLVQYETPIIQVATMHPERKWELVSAYQKSIRRGNAALAWQMAATLLQGNQEPITTYLWRRMAVTAAEDIGLANLKLIAFTLLCQQFFSPKKYPALQAKIVSFLTQELATSLKDRTLCNFATISMWAKKGRIENSEDEVLIEEVRRCEALANSCAARRDRQPYWEYYGGGSQLLLHLVVQDYRTEGMNRFIGLGQQCMRGSEPSEITNNELAQSVPPLMILGIPHYAFDMHTRTGKRSLLRFSEYQKVKRFLPAGTERLGALGYAVFHMEGGLLDRKLGYLQRDRIARLSRRLGLTGQGIQPEAIDDFLSVVKDALPVLNGLRMGIVHETYRFRYAPETNVSSQ